MVYDTPLMVGCRECELKRLKKAAKDSIDYQNYLDYFQLYGKVVEASADIIAECDPVWQVHISAADPSMDIPAEDRGLFFIAEYLGEEYTPELAKLYSKAVIKKAEALTGKRWYLSRVMRRLVDPFISVFYAAEGSGAEVIDGVGIMPHHGLTRLPEWWPEEEAERVAV